MRRLGAILFLIVAAHPPSVRGQTSVPAPLPLLDVPFISQSEALCGGAAAAMVLRFWGEREVSAESFAHLVDRTASGIRTDALIADVRKRGWDATGVAGSDGLLERELAQGRPIVALIQDRPGVYHYVVVVAHHDRGVVFHDPARLPFRVMPLAEFNRRWTAADRWMAVVTPRAGDASPAPDVAPAAVLSSCDRAIAGGVKAAQNNDLAEAERLLTSALSCSGPAAARELAGVRLLQRRWSEVDALANVAIGQDAADTHAWKLLGTARFIHDDLLGALDAWNHASEPRLDVVRIDGLARTRHRIVEQLLKVRTGDLLTAADLVRAQRRLEELPSAISTRLEYTPVPGGRAELHGVVAERSIFPTSPFSLGAAAVSAATAREVRVAFGSMSGGGEQLVFDWRFWDERRRVAAGVRAPAPWGGVWGVDAFRERQGFTSPAFTDTERTGVEVTQANWATARIRWAVRAGMSEWRGVGRFARGGATIRVVSLGGRLTAEGQTHAWMGDAGFAAGTLALRARTSVRPDGTVLLATAAIDRVSAQAPGDLWPAGDTGLARATLLRAHPLLAGRGRMRVSRIGRGLESVSLEGQRWWHVAAPLRVAAAAFTDVARTSGRAGGVALHDVDAGVGVRVRGVGVAGVLRIDLATGLSDGAKVLSFVYVVE